MNQEWSLHVERIGKIQEADIHIAPLLFFIGDNNSGKSYMMTILWGLLFLGKKLFPEREPDSRAYKRCEFWLRQQLTQEVVIDDKAITLYIDWFNELLNQKRKEFLLHLFNYKIESGRMEIRDYKQKKHLKLIFTNGSRYKFSSGRYIKFPRLNHYEKDDLLRMNTYICWNLLMGNIAAPLYTPVLRGRRNGEPVYLPTSRTGFMLTYHQLLEQSLQFNFGRVSISSQGKLTLPYLDFLQLITKFETRRGSKSGNTLQCFLKENMTDGSFKIEKTILPDFKYAPSDVQVDMPLHVTSSVITELAPISLLLQSGINFKTIVIEEPEAHLHPALQQKIAQFIVRLMNSGKCVWITTHSDTILQHVNNMLKLTNHKNKENLMERFKYTKDDLLQSNKVKMYQFSKSDDLKSTKVQELSAQKYGFVIPSFNNALEKILDEVYAFQEDEE